jgi:hypothetical protein
MRTSYALDGPFGALIGLRIPPSRSIVGIDEFAVEPPRVPISAGERFLEIAYLHALLHHRHPTSVTSPAITKSAPSTQNPFKFDSRSGAKVDRQMERPARPGCKSRQQKLPAAANGTPPRSPGMPSRLPFVQIQNRPSSVNGIPSSVNGIPSSVNGIPSSVNGIKCRLQSGKRGEKISRSDSHAWTG